MTIQREFLRAPLFALYGLYLVQRSIYRLLMAVIGLLRRPRQLACPTCGATNETRSRWICSECGAEYLGSVLFCGVCGAGASWFPCTQCHASIPLRSR